MFAAARGPDVASARKAEVIHRSIPTRRAGEAIQAHSHHGRLLSSQIVKDRRPESHCSRPPHGGGLAFTARTRRSRCCQHRIPTLVASATFHVADCTPAFPTTPLGLSSSADSRPRNTDRSLSQPLSYASSDLLAIPPPKKSTRTEKSQSRGFLPKEGIMLLVQWASRSLAQQKARRANGVCLPNGRLDSRVCGV